MDHFFFFLLQFSSPFAWMQNKPNRINCIEYEFEYWLTKRQKCCALFITYIFAAKIAKTFRFYFGISSAKLNSQKSTSKSISMHLVLWILSLYWQFLQSFALYSIVRFLFISFRLSCICDICHPIVFDELILQYWKIFMLPFSSTTTTQICCALRSFVHCNK